MTPVLAQLHQLFPLLNQGIDVFVLLLFRTLAFVNTAPVIGRRDLPFLVKVILAIFLTIALLPSFPKDQWLNPYAGNGVAFGLQILVNITIGFVLAFIADMIRAAITASGDIMNTQMGLSSAMMMDPSTKSQVMLLNNLFVFLFTVLFTQMGGMYWLIVAFQRSLELFPLFAINPKLPDMINLNYITHVSSNVLVIAVELSAPVLTVTLAMDLILGVLNKTAQQVPVFQLSAGLKPTVGSLALIATLPLFAHAVALFLKDFSRFF